MVVSSSPEGKEVVKRPRKLISGVSVDSLEKAEDDPEIAGKDVEVVSECAPKDRRANGAETEDHNLNRGSVLGGETKGSRVEMVLLVDVLIERTVMHQTMVPVVPGILHAEEESNLIEHGKEVRQRSVVSHSKV